MVMRKGFCARMFGYLTSVHDDVAAQIVSALKGKNVRFPNCRENQVNGDSTRTKELKLQFKVAAKVPFRLSPHLSPPPPITFLTIRP